MSTIRLSRPSASEMVACKVTQLKKAGLRGLGWNGLAQGLGLIIRLGSNLLLTRLLAPEVYGVLGTAMTVLTLIEWLSDMGIQPALMLHPQGDRREYLLTGWWLGLWRGLSLTLMVLLFAWPLTLFWDKPALFPILCVLSMRPVLLAMRSPGTPLLRRKLNYRAMFMEEMAQTIIGTGISVVLAFATRSVWAIVAGTMAGTLAAVVVSYTFVPYRLEWLWSSQAAKEIAGFSKQVLVNTVVMALWLNYDRLVGVRIVSLDTLGCYFLAWNLATIAETLASRACDVQFGLLSRMEGKQRQQQHDHVLDLFLFPFVPIAALGVILAPYACRILYDARYAQTGLLLALLLVRLVIRVLGQIQFQALMADEKVYLSTRAYLVALGCHLVMLPLLGSLLGAVGLAFSVLISTLIWTTAQTAFLPDKEHRIKGFERLFMTLVWMALPLVLLFFVA